MMDIDQIDNDAKSKTNNSVVTVGGNKSTANEDVKDSLGNSVSNIASAVATSLSSSSKVPSIGGDLILSSVSSHLAAGTESSVVLKSETSETRTQTSTPSDSSNLLSDDVCNISKSSNSKNSGSGVVSNSGIVNNMCGTKSDYINNKSDSVTIKEEADCEPSSSSALPPHAMSKHTVSFNLNIFACNYLSYLMICGIFFT